MKRLDLTLNMDTNEICISGEWIQAPNEESARLVFDTLVRLRDERDGLDAWADAMLAHLGQFPRLPSFAKAARPSALAARKEGE